MRRGAEPVLRVWIAADGERLARFTAALHDAGFPAQGVPVRRVPTIDERAAQLLLGLRWRLYPNRRAAEAWATSGLGFEPKTRIGACCAATAQLLEAAGAELSVVATRPDGKALALAVLQHAAAPTRSETVGILAGQHRATQLVAVLQFAGRRTRCVPVTTSMLCDWPGRAAVDVLVLTCPSAAAALAPDLGAALPLVALGPATIAALARRGWPAVQAVTPTPSGVVAALERLRSIATERAAST